jgi:hypothetical protein
MQKICLITLYLVNILYSQNETDQSFYKKKGIGFEFQEINSFLSESSSSRSMYFPMITEKWMIEPQLFFTNQSFETKYNGSNPRDEENSESASGFILGISYRTEHSKKVASYFGIEAGVANTKQTNGYYGEAKGNSELFGICFGVEYYISEHFSFGGDYAFRFGTYKEEAVGDLLDGYTRTGNLSGSVPVLMFRFYF